MKSILLTFFVSISAWSAQGWGYSNSTTCGLQEATQWNPSSIAQEDSQYPKIENPLLTILSEDQVAFLAEGFAFQRELFLTILSEDQVDFLAENLALPVLAATLRSIIRELSVELYERGISLPLRDYMSPETQYYLSGLTHKFWYSNILISFLVKSFQSNDAMYTCFFGPIQEELLYRFLIQELALKRVPKFFLNSIGLETLAGFIDDPRAAATRIFISAYIFTAVHTQHVRHTHYNRDHDWLTNFRKAQWQNALFIGSLIYGLMQEHTGSMYYSTIAHILHNTRCHFDD